ncbi:hypothetical protein FPOAC2_03918 [Fusarium poae]|jgi:hypothetical protein|uniref:hypothetical protein n=1 Tax=Fusarium poae TaxID=36050 RepID=UPI001CEB1965|nr:hypothetical protein FPOAC1_003804 [Fusarium poae]KAG8677776.1 hypothetical protein FPOAC1_003804 [Fusarium poae]
MAVMNLHHLISNITTTLKATIEICEKATDIESLPVPIQILCSQLPWIMAAFDKAKEGFPWSVEPSPDTLALKSILKDCAKKSSSLEACLRVMIPRAESSTFERYRRSLGLVPTEDKVVMLKDGLFSDLKALAANPAVDAETQDSVRSLVGFVTQEPGYNLWGVSDSD